MFQIALLAMALFMSMAAMAQSKIYYVSPTAQGTGDGLSWTNTMSLEKALTTAKAGDQIWVQGFEEITTDEQLYIAPATGFTLNSGVQLYGGFKGDETSINDRETLGKPYQLKYRSVLSGDIGKNDAVDNTNLIGQRHARAVHQHDPNVGQRQQQHLPHCGERLLHRRRTG